MRIFGDKNKTQAYLQRRKSEIRAERHAFTGELPRRPDAGTLLRTIYVTDHLTGQSYELEVRQAERKNGIDVFRFGSRLDVGGSYDGLFRFLRAKWKLRWLTA